jgi:hypoxanthine phosphoribosyltransferase
MAVSSYGKKGATSGEVRLVMDLREPVTDKHVLIVEDIIDTGQTLTYLLKTLKGRRPASLKTCVLVRKDRKSLDVAIDYLGFVIPDVWVVGYGLDYLDRYRTLPFIAELDRRVYDVPA